MSNKPDQLIEFVKNNDISAIREAVESGCDIDALSPDSETNALHVAIEYDNSIMVEELISLGANIEIVAHGLTPLQHAVDIKCLMINDDPEQEKDLQVITKLLDHKASLYSNGQIGENPIQIAKSYDCKPVLVALERRL